MNIPNSTTFQNSIDQYSSSFTSSLDCSDILLSEMPRWQDYIQRILKSQTLPENSNMDPLLQRAHAIQTMYNQPKITGNKLNRDVLLEWRRQIVPILKANLNGLKTFNACNQVLDLVSPYQRESFLKAISLKVQQLIGNGFDSKIAFSNALAYAMSRSMIEVDRIFDCKDLEPYTCPISGKIPFADSSYLIQRLGKDGKPLERYKRNSLEKWIRNGGNKGTDPATRDKVSISDIRIDQNAEKEVKEIICNYLYPGLNEANEVPPLNSGDALDYTFFAGLLSYPIVKKSYETPLLIDFKLDEDGALKWMTYAISLFTPILKEMDSASLLGFNWNIKEKTSESSSKSEESMQNAQRSSNNFGYETPLANEPITFPKKEERIIRLMQEFLKHEISKPFKESFNSSEKNELEFLREKLASKIEEFSNFFDLLDSTDLSPLKKRSFLNRAEELIWKDEHVHTSGKNNTSFTLEDLSNELSDQCMARGLSRENTLLGINKAFSSSNPIASLDSHLTPREEFLKSFQQSLNCQANNSLDLELWQSCIENILNSKDIPVRKNGPLFNKAKVIQGMYNRPQLSSVPINSLFLIDLRKEMNQILKDEIIRIKNIISCKELLEIVHSSHRKTVLDAISLKFEEHISEGYSREKALVKSVAYALSKTYQFSSSLSNLTSNMLSCENYYPEIVNAKESFRKIPFLGKLDAKEGLFLSAMLGYSVVKETYLKEVQLPTSSSAENCSSSLRRAQLWIEFSIELFAPLFQGANLNDFIKFLRPLHISSKFEWTDAQPTSWEELICISSENLQEESQWEDKINFMKRFLSAKIKLEVDCSFLANDLRPQLIAQMEDYLAYSNKLKKMDLSNYQLKKFQDAGISILLGDSSLVNIDSLNREEHSDFYFQEEVQVGSKRLSSSISTPINVLTLDSLLEKAYENHYKLGKKAKFDHVEIHHKRSLLDKLVKF